MPTDTPAGTLTGYFEVTVAMALLLPDGSFVNGDMADVTLAFGLPTPPPPKGYEAHSAEIIRVNLSRVAATVQTVLLANGAAFLGQVEEPMAETGREVGRVLSDAVRVRLTPVKEGSA